MTLLNFDFNFFYIILFNNYYIKFPWTYIIIYRYSTDRWTVSGVAWEGGGWVEAFTPTPIDIFVDAIELVFLQSDRAV